MQKAEVLVLVAEILNSLMANLMTAKYFCHCLASEFQSSFSFYCIGVSKIATRDFFHGR